MYGVLMSSLLKICCVGDVTSDTAKVGTKKSPDNEIAEGGKSVGKWESLWGKSTVIRGEKRYSSSSRFSSAATS